MTTRPDFEALFRASPSPCLVMDEQQLILDANDAYLQACGCGAAALLGRTLCDAIPDTPAQVAEALWLALASTQAQSLELNGKRLVHTFVAGVDGAPGLLMQTTTVFHAARLASTAPATDAMSDPRAAHPKDRFIAELAHQLRDPLAPINAAARLLLQVQLDERRLREMSDIIVRQVGHASALLDDLADVDRLAIGGVPALMMHPCDVKRIVNDAVEQLRPRADARGLRLAVLLPVDTLLVLGERRRLVQALAKLLESAIDHTSPGGDIVLSMDSDGVNALLRVRDDGNSIAAARLPQLFGYGAAAIGAAIGAPQRDAGIGMALARRLVALHGGTLVEAGEGGGAGSELTLTLPLAPAGSVVADVAQRAWMAPPLRPLRLMVVDDNPDAALTLSLLLEAAGYNVSTEVSAQAGLARALRELPDVCLLDIGMPGMDGYALARAMRANPALAGTTLIAVTGYSDAKDRLQATAAGFDHHLVKPVDGDALSMLLQECGRAILATAARVNAGDDCA